MKLLLIALFIVSLNVSCDKNLTTDNPEADKIELEFVAKAEAEAFLGAEDQMTRNWGKFDLSIFWYNGIHSMPEFLKYIADQTREWMVVEKEILEESLGVINQTIAEKGLKLPSVQVVKVIKSTMEEAGGSAGYTRGKCIILNSDISAYSSNRTSGLLAHELFHIFTRNDAELRRRMYAIIGFEILPREIDFPSELKDRIIVNPDVDRRDSYVTLTIGGKKRDCAMVIYADKPYNGGSLFDYVNVGLVEIDKQSCRAIEVDNKAVIYQIEEATDFFDKVGRNTEYLYDPEEILASNFDHMLTNQQGLKNPELIEKMAAICK